MVKPTQEQVALMVKFYVTIEAARAAWKAAAKISTQAIEIADSGKIVLVCPSGYKECYTFQQGPDYTVANYSKGSHYCTLNEWVGRSFEDFDRGMQGRGFERVTKAWSIGDRSGVDYSYVR